MPNPLVQIVDPHAKSFRPNRRSRPHHGLRRRSLRLFESGLGFHLFPDTNFSQSSPLLLSGTATKMASHKPLINPLAPAIPRSVWAERERERERERESRKTLRTREEACPEELLVVVSPSRIIPMVLWRSRRLYGKVLVIDGKMQSAEVDEFMYRECLIHRALLSHPKPKNVFIMGGGEVSAAREALKHKLLEKVVMCDID